MRLNPFFGWNQMSSAARALRVMIGIGVAAFAIWTLSPLFYSRQVNEQFPMAPAMAAPTADAVMAAPTADAIMQPTTDVMMAAEPNADAMAAPTADAMIKPTANTMMAATADTMAAPTADAMAAAPPAATAAPAGPQILIEGSFVSGATPGHHTSGSAMIYQLENGQRVLRIEDLDATNGPDLFVTLYTTSNPDESDGEHFQLAPLKGNQGSQNYELPAGLDLSQYHSVVIWCRSFNVVFGYAPLS
jgi:hypothetical protein